ncbi:hypothetical protein ACIQPR_14100 [Streptomyces sp. NPDC091280]|uniref:hypothetical protein n=1 Tax=Streptomyces sp. NPDC091280 TaxID=3365984 RepID=UPI003806E5F2
MRDASRAPTSAKARKHMSNQNKLITLTQVLICLFLAGGCSSPSTDSVEQQTSNQSIVLVDGDRDGYITYDTDREVLTGYTSDGTKEWQESKYFPTDVHCAGSCPNAVISATADTNEHESRTHTVWQTSDGSTVRSFPSKSMIVHWAMNKATWVATTDTSIVWSTAGKVSAKKFTKGLADSLGRVSADGSTLVISVQPNSSDSWSAFRFPLKGGMLSPSLISADLPGSVGCLSPDQRTMWTLGNDAYEFDLASGKKIREVSQYSSDCASSRNSTIIGAFSAGTGEPTQQIAITSAGRSAPVKKIQVESDGEIGIFQTCGVVLSNSKLAVVSPKGERTETKIRAHSAFTVPNGRVYSVGPSGKVEQHRITADGPECAIR